MTQLARAVTPHVPYGATARTIDHAEFAPAKVWVGNVNPGHVSTGFADSLAQMAAADLHKEWGCYQGKIAHRSGANVSLPRNHVVRDFLDETDGDWLLLIDSDMVFPPDTIVRLLTAACAADTKLIGALCVAVDEHGAWPTIYHPAPGAVTRLQLDYPDDTILQVYATGAACLMVHRDVLEAVRAAAPSTTYPWFEEREIRGRWVSEDIVFCLRVGELGFRAYVDCTLKIGHEKYGRVWTADDIRRNVSLAKRPIVAVIPTKDRLDLLRPLVEQIRGQGEAAEVIVCDNGSGPDTKAWLAGQQDITVLDLPDVGIHHMWNAGVDYVTERYGRSAHIAFLNNDLRLGAGFLGAMSRALESDNTLVAVSGNYDGRRHPGLVQHVDDICAGRYDGTGGLAGFAFMVNAAWFGGGYRFPEQCMWWYGDTDLVALVRKVGAKVGIALGAEVEHLDGGGKTGAWDSPEMQAQLAADKAAFFQRWAAMQRAELAQALRVGQLTVDDATTVLAANGFEAHNPTPGARVTVLTANFGDHDTVFPLPAQDIECDAILLTDRPYAVPGWRNVIVTLPEDTTPRLAAKRPRCRPDLYTDAEIVVWLDAHLEVTTSTLIGELVEQLGDGTVGAFRHGFHTTITQEAKLASTLAKYAGYDLAGQAKAYLEAGHPDDWGLWTTGVMVRRPGATVEFGNAWQAEIDQWGPEDQISLPVALRSTGTTPVDLPFEGWWKGDRFTIHPHTDGSM